MKLSLTAATRDGRMLPLDAPLELRFDANREVPCDALDVTLPLQLEGEVLRGLSASLEGIPFFEGIVDRQTVEKSGDGRFLRLSCRSGAALLVDNEVRPAVYFSLTSGQLLERYALPFGVAGAELPYEGRLEVLQVGKGESCWQVIERFCRRVYRKTPALDKRRNLVLDPPGRAAHQLRGNDYAALSIRWKNDRLLSRLYIKTATEKEGYFYGLAVDNPEAKGILRERYYHPAAKDAADLGGEADRLLREANRAGFEAEVLLPGFYAAEIGDRVSLPEEGISGELCVLGMAYRMGAGGVTTRLTLVKREFL